MEFSVSRADLVRELVLARGVVEQKTTIPILSNVVIETGEDCIHITATDLELGIRCSCPATITQAGSGTLPAKRLLDYVRLLPEADVQIQVKTTDNHWASLKCERSKSRIAGMSRDSFPELPVAQGPVAEIPIAVLAVAIHKTMFAISKEASRFTMNGALLSLSESTLTLAATDGHRMALVEVPHGGTSASVRVIVPLKALAELLNLAKDDAQATVRYSEDENNMFFAVGRRTLSSRKMSGNFPDYSRVMPRDYSEAATINRESLKGALERVAQFSDERSKRVTVSVVAGEVKVHSSISETGESEETIPATYEGKGVEIGFNASYLLDFLRVASTEEATLMFKDAGSAAELRPTGEDGYRVVVMPMRV